MTVIRRSMTKLLFLAAVGAGFATMPAFAQDDRMGADEFRISCASCHGLDAKGDGPIASYLTVAPPDLTMLAKNNRGEYPFLKVFQIIDGRSVVRAHGNDMPVWGDRYRTAVEAPGSIGSQEQMIRARVLELVYYIQTIQEK